MATRRIWQIGAGTNGRFYSDLFEKYDVMLLGPGRFGPYNAAEYAKANWSRSQLAAVRQLATGVMPDDIVVMREGHRIVGIGVVQSTGYQHLPQFDEVYGWDLQHAHRVSWQPQLNPLLKSMQERTALFSHMKQVPMFTQLHHEPTVKALSPLLGDLQVRDLNPLPDNPSSDLLLPDFGELLFSRGLANDVVDKVLAAIARQRRLLKWYGEHGGASKRPTEHEVVSHMILPLLLALGWSEQLLAVEWNKVDLAGFNRTPTTPDSCCLVTEAKGADFGLLNAREQAISYTEKLKLANCNRALVTDGRHFYLIDRDGASFTPGFQGYLNINRLRTRYVVPDGASAVETLIALTPAMATQPLCRP